MKYCYECNRITPGEPLYCNTCGHSYNVKLCPHRHQNPRTAQACSQCGSRDLSKPQPRVPLWAPILEFVLSCVPGLLLVIGSVTAIVLVIQALIQNPSVLGTLAVPIIMLLILWWLWAQIPRWFREAIYRLLKRRRDGDERRRHS
jgi:DNA-directed RNA polymerase subunit RPC12/RpoP